MPPGLLCWGEWGPECRRLGPFPISLRAPYAMSGTDIATNPACPAALFASMPATRCPVPPTPLLRNVRYCIRACYAMSGSEVGYGGA
eukprot:2797450-Rhodomonas_salina.1